MAKLSLLAGTTSKSVKLFIQNNSVTTGAGLTGLTSSTSGLTAYYIREGASSTTQITLASATLGTFTSGGFILADATNMPGVYELGIPNAALASGAKSVLVYLQGATNMAPQVLEIELTAVDNQSTTYGLATLNSNVTAINSVATTSVTAVAANVGTAQPLNFTGTSTSALVKSDMQDIAGAAVSTSSPQIGVNVVNMGGSTLSTSTAQVGVNVVSVAGAASNFKKNQILSTFSFLMTDSTNHAPKTGCTVTATRSIDGGAFGACTNAVTEVGGGSYSIVLSAADMNGDCIMLQFTATGADARFIEIITQP